MNLAFCLFKYFPFGGLQRDFLRIANECLARKHNITIYTMQWEGEKNPAFQYQMLDVSGMQNHAKCYSFSKKLSKTLATNHHDLVIGFNKLPDLDLYYAADVCYQARVKEKHHALYRLLPRYQTLRSLEEAVFKAGSKTKILLISKTQQQFFQACYQTEDERFYLLPPGINKDRIAPTDAENIRKKIRNDFHLSDNDILLLAIGSGFKTKGLDRTLCAIASLPDDLKSRTTLLVIGQDHPAPFMKLAKQFNIEERISFLGGLNNVPDYLLAADFLLHPAYHENTGTVIVEAIVAGLPVLTTDVCGYAHYVNDANAGRVIASPFNQNEFNQVLKEMIRSKQQRIWRENGIAFAKNHDLYSLPEKVVDRIEEIGRERGLLS